jgi:hypothetical protein
MLRKINYNKKPMKSIVAPKIMAGSNPDIIQQ